MSDRTQRDDIELDSRKGAVGQDATFEGLYPFEAFEFDDPNISGSPHLKLKSPWILELTSVLSYSARGEIMSVKSTGSDYTITDNDGYTFVRVTTAATDVTITLPTASDNKDRVIGFLKDDSGSGKMTLDGEGTEKIHAQGQNQNTLDFELEDSGCYLLCDGTQWLVIRAIGCELWDIGGTVEAVYGKFLSGTTDGDSLTQITHGISDTSKVVAVFIMVSNGNYYLCSDCYDNSYWQAELKPSTFDLNSVAAAFQSDPYRLVIKYYI